MSEELFRRVVVVVVVAIEMVASVKESAGFGFVCSGK